MSGHHQFLRSTRSVIGIDIKPRMSVSGKPITVSTPEPLLIRSRISQAQRAKRVSTGPHIPAIDNKYSGQEVDGRLSLLESDFSKLEM
jgi:hypothetical protein